MPYNPILLANRDRPNGHTLAVYESTGGYQGLRRAVQKMSPADVQKMVKAAGLRGRGGAGFPTGQKWSFLPKDRPGPIYLCVNADESEPGTFVNRIQMETDPHQVLEGVLLTCYAIGATTAYIYIRYEYPTAYARMQTAIDECRAAGIIGQHVLGGDFSVEVFLHRGAAAYVCGEETGLIESLEGRRAWPRIKPPFPAVEGLFHRPTIVNNVETMTCVKQIVDRGVDWFRSIGVSPDPKNPRDLGSFGPKLFGLSGHVNRPGCYEAPLGITLRQLVEEFGGGVWQGRRAKAAVLGGLSTGLVTEAEFDVPLDFSSPMKVGCLGLGTGCVTVFDETYPIVDFLHNSCRFFAHESCGQCTPCREGTQWALEMIEAMKAGRGRPCDLDLLSEIGDTIGIMPGTTICGLADGAAWPIKTAIKKFRGELEKTVNSG